MKTKQLIFGCCAFLCSIGLQPLLAAIPTTKIISLNQTINVDSLIPEYLFLDNKSPYSNNVAKLFGLQGSLARWRYYTDEWYRKRVDMWNRIYNNGLFDEFNFESGFGLAGNANPLPFHCTALSSFYLGYSLGDYNDGSFYGIYGYFPNYALTTGYVAQPVQSLTEYKSQGNSNTTEYMVNEKLPTTKKRFVSASTKSINESLTQHLINVKAMPLWDAIPKGEFKIKNEEDITAVWAQLKQTAVKKGNSDKNKNAVFNTIPTTELNNASQTVGNTFSNNNAASNPTVLSSVKGRN